MCMKVQAKHGKVTQNMHGASRNYRYVWDVSAADGPPRESIYLSKESMAMVKEAVALGTLLPSSASRDELRAYNKLAGGQTQQTRQWRLAMEKQEKEELEQKNSRRKLPRSDSPGFESPARNKSKLNNLRKTEKARVVRKLDDDFRLEEDDDEEQ